VKPARRTRHPCPQGSVHLGIVAAPKSVEKTPERHAFRPYPVHVCRTLCQNRPASSDPPTLENPMDDPTLPNVRAIRPDRKVLTRQKIPYFIGVSGQTVGAQGLSMHVVVIPPGARSEPHSHRGYETAIYVLEGRVETRYGAGLSSSIVSEAGDFLFIPPGVPHEAINLSQSEPARAIVARNDPAEQDKVDPYTPPANS